VTALALIFALTVISFWLSLQRPRLILYAAVFLAPWQGLDVDVGLRITAHLAVFTPLAVVTLLRVLEKGALAFPLTRASGYFVLFAAYAVIWSLFQLPFLPHAEVAGGELRSPVLRAAMQIPMFLVSISPTFLVPQLLRQPSQLASAARVYLLSSVVLAALGWVQLFTWYSTGWNPMPIGLVDSLLGGIGEGTREASFEYESLIYRMNSFAGEPKFLGAALVVALLFIQVWWDNGGRRTARTRLLWLFLAASGLATFSTTAIYLWIIGSMALAILKLTRALRGHHGWRRALFGSAISLTLVTAGIVTVVTYSSTSPESGLLIGLFQERTIGRESAIFEDTDDAVLQYLADEPMQAVLGVGMGNVHLYADPYLEPMVAVYAGGGSFVAKSGYLRTVSELGILGLALWFTWTLRQIREARMALGSAYPQKDSSLLMAIPNASLIMVLLFLGSGMVAPQFYFVLGACAALANTWPPSTYVSQLKH